MFFYLLELEKEFRRMDVSYGWIEVALQARSNGHQATVRAARGGGC